LALTAVYSRQYSTLQNLTLPALMPPLLLQVPEEQYPDVSGLAHLAGAGVGIAAKTASMPVMNAANQRFVICPSLGPH